jgi:hypothetical protein
MKAVVEEVKAIEKELSKYTPPSVPSDAPSIPVKYVCMQNATPLMSCRDMPDSFPLSYATNSDRELLVHAFVKNFERQFRDLYRSRKPLLMLRPNECGVEVCGSVCPLFPSIHPSVHPCMHASIHIGDASIHPSIHPI